MVPLSFRGLISLCTAITTAGASMPIGKFLAMKPINKPTCFTDFFICFSVLFGIGLWKIILFLSAPLSFIKTGISLIQLGAAMNNIVIIDNSDREKLKAQKSQ